MSAALTTEHLRATQSAFRRWKTVLVVDQYAPICEMVARHLSASGYRVLTAGSATDASESFEPSLI